MLNENHITILKAAFEDTMKIQMTPQKEAWKAAKSLEIDEKHMTSKVMETLRKAHKQGYLPELAVKTWDKDILQLELPHVTSMCKCSNANTRALAVASEIRCLLCIEKMGYLPGRPYIEKLALDGNKNASWWLNDQFIQTWPVLKELSMNGCCLDRADAAVLGRVNQQQHLPCLKVLLLDNNPGISGGLQSLLSNIWPTLEYLVMSRCSLSSEDIQAWVRQISYNDYPVSNS